MKRIKIEVQGYVQGVGFRPHVYRIATKLGLTGWVKNNAVGVQIEIQGHAIKQFLSRLNAELPTLARIDQVSTETISYKANETKFRIVKSESGCIATKISADTAICKDCLRELFDPNSQYHLYPFINCIHCGPRYTIMNSLPYDRIATSMAEFVMCNHCSDSYKNPRDRRYHAQPIGCEQCGPKLNYKISTIAEAINSGKIVAAKGLGGYQLICNGQNQQTIEKLREQKQRSKKPFALMVLNSCTAKKFVCCSEFSKELLEARERPIVVLPKNKGKPSLSEAIAPNLNSYGIMLPHSPFHYLLFYSLLGCPQKSNWLNKANDIVLIVTSGNQGGCPLIKDDEKAKRKLFSCADIIVNYNRDIVTQVDDSVVGLVKDKAVFIRRARGYTPHAIALPHEIPVTLALGGYLKNTVCVTRGKEAFLSQHIGSLNNRETMHFYRETISHLLKILNVKLDCVAHDLHPEFYSTKISEEFNVPTFPVQHHHAHLAACAVEHGIQTNALGLALDGFGLGENCDSRGGELILYQHTDYTRLGSLKPLIQPSGDIAAREPWRMAAGVLFELGKIEEIAKRFKTQSQAKQISEILEKQLNSPRSSSCGRLFDAASSLLGLCEISSYEGEAAMMLESRVNDVAVAHAGWRIENNQLNMFPLLKQLITCNDPVLGANLFHGTLTAGLVEWVNQNAQEQNLKHVLLSGGCFLNKVLSEKIIDALKKMQLIPLYPRQAPPNDGGISLGQAWIAGNSLLKLT